MHSLDSTFSPFQSAYLQETGLGDYPKVSAFMLRSAACRCIVHSLAVGLVCRTCYRHKENKFHPDLLRFLLSLPPEEGERAEVTQLDVALSDLVKALSTVLQELWGYEDGTLELEDVVAKARCSLGVALPEDNTDLLGGGDEGVDLIDDDYHDPGGLDGGGSDGEDQQVQQPQEEGRAKRRRHAPQHMGDYVALGRNAETQHVRQMLGGEQEEGTDPAAAAAAPVATEVSGEDDILAEYRLHGEISDASKEEVLKRRPGHGDGGWIKGEKRGASSNDSRGVEGSPSQQEADTTIDDEWTSAEEYRSTPMAQVRALYPLYSCFLLQYTY